MPIFTRRNDLRIKQEILRGVFEDNLRIVGKGHSRKAGAGSFFLRKMVLSLLLTAAAVLFLGSFFDNALSPEKALKASTLSPVVPASQVKSPLDHLLAVSDYKAFMNNRDASLSRLFGLGVKTIMIDAGHGGTDTGTIGKMGTREKDITLDIAKRLKNRLAKTGRYQVLLTRESDSTTSLSERVKIAQAAKADLFISVHLNYLPARPINMIETYYFGPASDAKIRELAEKENAGSEYVLSDFREMIGKIGETLKLQESREFAASIQDSLFVNSRRDNGNIYDFGIKRAPFVVLLGVDVPAVLAEVSCLSNRLEEKELNTESHRENIAHYLEAGILDYLRKGDFKHEAGR